MQIPHRKSPINKTLSLSSPHSLTTLHNHSLCALRPPISLSPDIPSEIIFSDLLFLLLLVNSDPSMGSVTASSVSFTSLACSLKQNQGLARSSVSLAVKGKAFPALRLQSAPLRFRVSCEAKPATVDKVCEIVRKQLALPADSAVTGESKFAALGADSLDTVEIVMGLEEEFGISVEEESAQTIATVQDAADLIEQLVEKKGSA